MYNYGIVHLTACTVVADRQHQKLLSYRPPFLPHGLFFRFGLVDNTCPARIFSLLENRQTKSQV